MKKLILIGLLCLMPTLAEAQTITATAAWQQPGPDTLANIQAYIYTLKIDAGPANQIAQVCVPPVAPATIVTCTAPVTIPQTSGTHTLTLTATNAFGSASTSTTGSSPGTPVSFTIIVKYTVP